MHLAYAEYDDLSVLERIAILRGLSALTLSADAVRDHISARLDAMPAPVAPLKRKVCISYAGVSAMLGNQWLHDPWFYRSPDFIPYGCVWHWAEYQHQHSWGFALQKEDGDAKEGAKEEDSVAAEAAKAAAAAVASAAGSAEEWERWMEASRVGVRRPLGTDSHKRRYWALGGRASAWRLYVEEHDSGLWGWYEGGPPIPNCIPFHKIGRILADFRFIIQQ